MIDALEDAGGMGDDGVGDGPAQVGRREAFQQFVRDAVGGQQGDAQRLVVGDAGAVEVGRRDVEGVGQPEDLMAGPVDQDDANAQAAQ